MPPDPLTTGVLSMPSAIFLHGSPPPSQKILHETLMSIPSLGPTGQGTPCTLHGVPQHGLVCAIPWSHHDTRDTKGHDGQPVASLGTKGWLGQGCAVGDTRPSTALGNSIIVTSDNSLIQTWVFKHLGILSTFLG